MQLIHLALLLTCVPPQQTKTGAQPPFPGVTPPVPSSTIMAAPWDVELHHAVPCSPTSTDNDGCGYAYASVYSAGEAAGQYVYAKGRAQDSCTGTEAFAQMACTSTLIESWQYIGNKQGLVTASAILQVNGVVHLNDDDCAGAALGFVTYSSAATQSAVAVLSASAAETVSVLGPLSFDIDLGGGVVITITPTVSTGLGTYHDSDSHAVAGQECMGFFTHTKRARGAIEAYANSFAFGSSSMRCSMVGTVSSTVVLSEK